MAVIGAGNMGAALIGGVLKAGVVSRENLRATVRGELHAGELAGKFGIAVTAGENRDAAKQADIVVLAVKPSTVPQVMREIRDVLTETHVLVSLAASLPMNVIDSLAGRTTAGLLPPIANWWSGFFARSESFASSKKS
jgi:pyrroline-5-carboxylate reductase